MMLNGGDLLVASRTHLTRFGPKILGNAYTCNDNSLLVHFQYRRIVMLACGTGIAPMIQVIRAVVENEDDETFLHLVYGSKSQNNILLKSEIDHFATYWNFTVLHSLSKTSQSSLTSHPGLIKYADKVHMGRIDKKLVEQEVPHPQNDHMTFVLVCGTDSFNNDMIKYLTEVGYNSDMYFKY